MAPTMAHAWFIITTTLLTNIIVAQDQPRFGIDYFLNNIDFDTRILQFRSLCRPMIIDERNSQARAYLPTSECPNCKLFGKACEIFPAGVPQNSIELGRPPIECVDVTRECWLAYEEALDTTNITNPITRPTTRAPPPRTTTTTTARPPSTVPCINAHKFCCFWASKGECTVNPIWMNIVCRPACGRCPPKNGRHDCGVPPLTVIIERPRPQSRCHDHHRYCQFWSGIGECARNPRYMLLYCARSCRTCGVYTGSGIIGAATVIHGATPTVTALPPATGLVPSSNQSIADCTNHHFLCPLWATQTECQKNPSYMQLFCRQACGLCNGTVGLQTTGIFTVNKKK